jgi:hypothetical protein
MSLDDILYILATGETGDWYRPTLTEERTVAVYRPDVNLRAEITYDEEGTHCENFSEAWTRTFPNKSARSRYVRVWYGQTPIKVYILVSVDGGRAYLPLPDLNSDNGYIVSKEQYFIASLFDTIDTLDRYMRMAEFSVR